ncbi:MAG: DUF3798 domain-containing protein [Tissierellaceae bacterium]|nr:DUF3798 domain-containing protein [Tissierellaceae bacterium]
MKKIIALLLVTVMLVGVLAGCSQGSTDTSGEGPGYKIGIVTGTVSQGEEEFRAAQNMVEKYGKDVILHVTYPDRFAQETETTISQIASLASDPEVKAIVITQAVTGTAAAIDRIKETRDDIAFILGAPHEDPSTIASRADVILDVDQLARGRTIIETAAEMGAETFVHYSFPRHLAMELLAARRDILKETAEEYGIQFVEVDAPDPTGDAGVPGAQQFILEDVPRQVDKYGENTAFFSTNCGMQEPLIKQSLETGGIYPEQCCPSPYHAYPGALGIAIPEENAGDIDYISDQIALKVAEKGGTGRFGTWQIPANPAMIEAGVAYGIEYAQGNIDKNDPDAMISVFEGVAEEKGVQANFSVLDGTENYLLFTISSQIF